MEDQGKLSKTLQYNKSTNAGKTSQEYVFCTKCVDIVHTYCSIHGPPLVIPDSKVSTKGNYSSCVPHAALTIPHAYLHLAWSIIPGASLGVFSTQTIPQGVRFGPYRGQITDKINSSYCWQILDGNNKPLHVVDAMDPNCSNWMRYVNCSRHWSEQNLIAYQYQGQIYYSTIKTIPKYTELLVFYGSEFANLLNINLRKYNDERFYRDILEKRQTLENCLKDDVPQIIEENLYDDQKNHFHDEIIGISNTASYQNLTLPANPTNLEKSFSDTLKPIDYSVDIPTFYHNNMDYNNNETNHSFDFTTSYDKEKRICVLDASHSNKNNTGFTCDLCGKCMKLKTSLRRHLRSHSKDTVQIKSQIIENKTSATTLNCDICYKTLSCNKNLRRHRLTHLPVKRFQCVHCNFTTNENYKLTDHLGVHTKEIMYRCYMCNYFSYTKLAFKSHKRIHKHAF